MLCNEELELLSQVHSRCHGGIRVWFVENPRQEAGKHCIQFLYVRREDGTRIPIRVERSQQLARTKYRPFEVSAAS